MYTSTDLVKLLHPHIPIEEMLWMVDNLDCYAVATSYAGWQFSKGDRYFRKTGLGWIECRRDGSPIFKVVAKHIVNEWDAIENDYQVRVISRRN